MPANRPEHPIPFTLAVAAALVVLSASGQAQMASSPGYALHAWTLDARGGGASSPGHSAWIAEESAGGPCSSASYGAWVGFLGVADPTPTNAPVVFGLSPPYGTKDGGTAVAVHGLNFDKFGAGASVMAWFDAVPATGLSVLSNTQLQLSTPAGEMGPADVRVASTWGSDTAPGAFIYTPAVISHASASLGSTATVANYGPLGGSFELWTSPLATSLPLPPYGTLLIGPTPIFKLFSAAYPGPNGIHQVGFPVPFDPSLSGAAFHFQSVAVVSFAPLAVVLTNRSTTILL